MALKSLLAAGASRGAIAACSFLCAVPALAQTGPTEEPIPTAEATQTTGGISGTVTDSTGARLRGALVRIPSLGRETSTNLEGRFAVEELPPGTYQVEVLYFGGEPFGAEVAVAAGQVTTVQLVAAPAADIVVTGIRGNISASRSRERTSDVLQTVISSDAAGEFGDQNLAESLQRAPGVSITRSEGEGTQVSIRGLAPEFTKVTIDGVNLGASGDGRESSVDILSSDLASAITINKYQLPDQPADAIGGTVNVESISAFTRGGFSLNFRAEASYQEERDAISPFLSANGTWLTGIGGEDNLGISFAANWSKRKLAVDVIEGSDAPYLYEDREGDVAYVPDKIIAQRELADRTRWGASGGLEFRPTDQDRLYLRSTYARDYDLDQAYILEWDIDNSQSGGNNRGNIREVMDVEQDSFILSDADVLMELSYQPEIDKTLSLNAGGEHVRGDWTADYQGFFTRRKIYKDDYIKGEWREQNILVAGSTTPDGFDIDQISIEEAQQLTGLTNAQLPPLNTRNGDIYDPSNFDQIQVQTEDGLRNDRMWSGRANLRRDFHTAANLPGFVKAGVLYLDRQQIRDRNRKNYNPTNSTDRRRICGTTSSSDPCVQSLGTTADEFDLSIPNNSIITLPIPTFDQVVPVFRDQAGQFLDLATFGTDRDHILTTSDDYEANEDVYAGYAMGQVKLNDQLTVTGGLRLEHTRFASTGHVTVFNDEVTLEGDPAPLIFTAPLGEAANRYTDIFPSLLLRFEPRRDMVFRAAYSTSTQRPSFRQARNSIVSDDDLEIDDQGTTDPSDDTISSELTLSLGRPDLKPYYARNFDVSWAWYPNNTTVISVAPFYKRINNFIVDAEFNGVTLAELGFINLPAVGQFTFDPNAVYDSIETTINGDRATVYGVEFDVAHTFKWMPHPMDNLFLQANLTLARSKSAVSVLRDETIPLVGQADVVGNLSFGYEDRKFTARVAANYSGERLAELGGTNSDAQTLDPDSPYDRFDDQYIESFFSMDASFRYRLTPKVQLSFDAININEASDDINFKRSDRDYFSEREIFGRTFKAGVRISY